MKYYRSAKLLYLICLLYLHCCPYYCDKENDAPILNDSREAHKVLPTHSSRAQNVPTKQDKVEKINIDIENSQSVQPSVEYVNNDVKIKGSKQFVDQIGSVESLHVSSEKIKLKENGIKNSQHLNQQDPQIIDNTKSSASMPNMLPTSKNSETKSQTTIVQPVQSPVSDQVSNKLIKSSEPGIGQNVLHQKTGSSEFQDTNSLAREDVTHQQYDGMPSFDEWKKMMLAQQEKGGAIVIASSPSEDGKQAAVFGSLSDDEFIITIASEEGYSLLNSLKCQKVLTPSPPGKKLSSQKRRRNYSSYECGAKIVGSNPEADSTSRILNELVDEYMLNPCKAKIWFVIELCETVQASQIELSNFELFSSCPKDFSVYSSDNFPTRDWVPLGTFTAAEQRVLQSFELKQEGFGKFIKVELNSHYGEEHYCPLSVVRIFGTSMVDEYEEMETLSSHPDIPDDDLDRLDIPVEDKKSNNIFGSATDAVMNIMKKAAEALGQKSMDDKQSNETSTDTQNHSDSKICNLMDDSSNECKAASVGDKSSLSPLSTFLGSSFSMQQSLFRLLHRCDQCSSPHVRYYSSAQPHCRFFQAALGPVSFQALCDWFKEHPLAIAYESPAPHQKDSSGGAFVITPTKSPPPQIMRIPTESDLTLKHLLNDTLSIPYSNNSMAVNLSLPVRSNKSASVHDKIILQSSIKPTQTIESSQSRIYNDSTKTSIESLKENIKSSVYSINEMLSKGSVSVSEKAISITKESSLETATLIVSDYTVTSDLLTDSEKAQISEFLSDSGAVSSEDLHIDLASTTELPPGFKSDDIYTDTQEKLEPVPVGSISAGQKESVFMKMSNRIKALEINMSLSSQYLQELSQRYRRQMDELQRRTIGTLNDTAIKAAEVDVKQQEVLNNLQLQVANLTGTVERLLAERSLVFREMIETHICLMVIEVIIMVTIMSLCVRRINIATKQDSIDKKTLSPSRLSKRRNTVDSCTPPIARKVKKRSNSEENLNAETLIVKPIPISLDPILKTKKRNKRRYKGSIQRSISHPHMQHSCNSTNSSHGSQHHNHSEGCVHPNTKAKQNPLIHACENCDNNMCAGMKFPNKERRPNGMPLQNLTNGSVLQEKSTLLNKKEKFSFKKLLKFQKRDSI